MPAYCFFCVLSVEEPELLPLAEGEELEEPEPLADGEELEPLPLVEPLPALSFVLSLLDELELELGLLGVAEELELEPDGELGVVTEPEALELDGEDDGVVVLPLPEVADEPDLPAVPPLSPQPAIIAPPNARETATAKVETFMWPPWLGYREGRARSEPRATARRGCKYSGRTR